MKQILATLLLSSFVATFMDICVAENDRVINSAQLKNGFQIVHIPTDSNGVVYVGVLYHVGAGDDPICKTGLSHFLEHMMFKGTANISGGELKRLLNTYTSYTNACTGHDLTFYYHSLKVNNIDLILKIEADRMKNLAFNMDDFIKERNVVMEERHMRYDANPLTRHIMDAIPRALFLYSTYGYPVAGYPWQIERYDKKTLVNHYRTYYTPNNAVLIVVGDIDAETLFAKANKYFGCILNSAAEPPFRKRVKDPIDPGIKYTIERSIPEIKTSELSVVYSFNADIVKSAKDRLVLSLLVRILSSPSVLRKILVDEQQLAYNINISATNMRFAQNAFLEVDVQIKNGVDFNIVQEQLFRILNRFENEHLTQDLFDKNKKCMINDYDLSFDSPGKIFNSVAMDLMNGLSVRDMQEERHIIESISIDDVIAMMRKVLIEGNIKHQVLSHPKAH